MDQRELDCIRVIERHRAIIPEIEMAKKIVNANDWRLSWPIPFVVATFNFSVLYISYIFYRTDWSIFWGILGSVFSVRILFQYFSLAVWKRNQNRMLDTMLSEVMAHITELERIRKTHSSLPNPDKP